MGCDDDSKFSVEIGVEKDAGAKVQILTGEKLRICLADVFRRESERKNGKVTNERFRKTGQPLL